MTTSIEHTRVNTGYCPLVPPIQLLGVGLVSCQGLPGTRHIPPRGADIPAAILGGPTTPQSPVKMREKYLKSPSMVNFL